MKTEVFIEIFKNELDNLLSEDIISGRKEIDTLYLLEMTYLINVAIYLTVKKYRKKYKPKVLLIPEAGGRFPSDFVLKSHSGKIELVIEHENSEEKILKNYRKLIDYTGAKARMLICYVRDYTKIDDMIKKLKREKIRKKTRKKVNVLIAKKGDAVVFTGSDDFRYFII